MDDQTTDEGAPTEPPAETAPDGEPPEAQTGVPDEAAGTLPGELTEYFLDDEGVLCGRFVYQDGTTTGDRILSVDADRLEEAYRVLHPDDAEQPDRNEDLPDPTDDQRGEALAMFAEAIAWGLYGDRQRGTVDKAQGRQVPQMSGTEQRRVDVAAEKALERFLARVRES